MEIVHGQPAETVRIADRVQPRAFAGFEGNVLAKRVWYNEDVRKQDCRIETVSAQRLKGDVRCFLRIVAEVEKTAGDFANGPVFGKVPPGLAHKPHRWRVHTGAVQGLNDRFHWTGNVVLDFRNISRTVPHTKDQSIIF